jgi:hypothetical protein
VTISRLVFAHHSFCPIVKSEQHRASQLPFALRLQFHIAAVLVPVGQTLCKRKSGIDYRLLFETYYMRTLQRSRDVMQLQVCFYGDIALMYTVFCSIGIQDCVNIPLRSKRPRHSPLSPLSISLPPSRPHHTNRARPNHSS